MTSTVRCLVLLLCGLVAVPAAQRATFRAATASISVDVSVRRDGRPVTDLAPGDFEVLDAGVPQTVAELTRETLPIDVTFVVDLSGSVQGPLLAALTRAITAVGAQLRDTDRAAVVTFNQRIRQLQPLTAGGWPAGLSLGTPASLTALFDAVTMALVVPPEIGRRRMAIVFTDGIDTASFLDGEGVIEMARRSSTSVFTVALSEGTVRNPQRPAHAQLFQQVADTTGGLLQVLQRDQDLSRTFVETFDAFRTSYVLHYTYDGPALGGWHPIEVRVRRAGQHEVRARQGYFAAAP